jgi:hypothetical protein
MVFRFDAVIRPVRPAAMRGLSAAALAVALFLGVAGCGENEPVERLVAEAVAMRDAGDLRTAAIRLNAALAQQPKNVPARLLAAQL